MRQDDEAAPWSLRVARYSLGLHFAGVVGYAVAVVGDVRGWWGW